MSPSDLDRPAEAGGHELELGVAERAHLGQIEPLELGLGAHPLTDEDIDQPVEQVRDGEDDTDEGAAADQLSHELSGVAVEEPGDGAIHPVPAAAVVARPIGEEPEGEDTPEPARAV